MRRRLDLQAKIILVLVAVILPTSLIVTIAENKITLPLLEDEIRQIGINSGKTLAAEIDSSRMLSLPNPGPALENAVQEILYTQPNIVRIDVIGKDPVTGAAKLLASSVEEDANTLPPSFMNVDAVTSEPKLDEGGGKLWDIFVPIEHHSRDHRTPRKLLGSIHVVISTKLISRIGGTLWRTTFISAAFSVVCLILALTYFLRKTIANDRLLREAETQNLQLTEQLHEAQRELMNTEKLAVMGQLTASFAHEIGTPLNAIGGHLQLLKEEVEASSSGMERIGIMAGQLDKIESIVKGFLQSTAKPISQKQLVDLNRLADKTLGIVLPRVESLGIRIKRDFDRTMGPMRLVPLDIEQVLLNLLNNSLDGIKSNTSLNGAGNGSPNGFVSKKEPYHILVSTERVKNKGKDWAQITVFDKGGGIKKADLPNVLKPFFTTKRPGEGTGLGLTICQQIARKYGGDLLIDSKEGAWTRVTLKLPYHANT